MAAPYESWLARRRGGGVYGGPASAFARPAPQAPPQPTVRPAGANGQPAAWQEMSKAIGLQRQQSEQQQAAGSVLSDLGEAGGIGGAIQGGIMKGLGGAANALGFLGRGVVSTLDAAAGTGLGTALGLSGAQGGGGAGAILTPFVMGDATKEDDRDWWERVQDVQYGYGQATVDTGNAWVDNTTGFTGDVLTDPLSYITLGSGTVASTSGRAALAGQASSMGMADNVVQALGKYGPSHVDEATRTALGLGPSNLKFAGEAIPGTARVGAAMSRTTSAAREGIMSTRAGQWARGLRGDALTKEARRVLYTGQAQGSLTPSVAADVIRITDGIKGMGGQIAKTYGQRMEQALRGLSSRDGAAIMEGLESGIDSPIRQVLNDLRNEMERVGINVGSIENYAPHRWSQQGREWLAGGSDDAVALRQVMGDATAAPGAIKTRSLKPGSEITINGKPHTLKDGTIKEINDLFQAELGFKALVDDPRVLLSGYLAEVSRAVGVNRALKDYFASASPNVSTLEHVGKDVLTEYAKTANEGAAKSAREFIERMDKRIADENAALAREIEDARKLAISSSRAAVEGLDVKGAQRSASTAKGAAKTADAELAALEKDVAARTNILNGQIEKARRKLGELDEKIGQTRLEGAARQERIEGGYDVLVDTEYSSEVRKLVDERDAARREIDQAQGTIQALEEEMTKLQARLVGANQEITDDAVSALATSRRSPVEVETRTPVVERRGGLDDSRRAASERYVQQAIDRVAAADYDGAVRSAQKAVDDAIETAKKAEAKLARAQAAFEKNIGDPSMRNAAKVERYKANVESAGERQAAAAAQDAEARGAQQALGEELADEQFALGFPNEEWNVDAAVERMSDLQFQYAEAVARSMLAGGEAEEAAAIVAQLAEQTEEMYRLGLSATQRRRLDAAREASDAHIRVAAANEALDAARYMARRAERTPADAAQAMAEIERVLDASAHYIKVGEQISKKTVPPPAVRTPEALDATVKAIDDQLNSLADSLIPTDETVARSIRTGGEVQDIEVQAAARHLDALLVERQSAAAKYQRLKNAAKELQASGGGSVTFRRGGTGGLEDLEWEDGVTALFDGSMDVAAARAQLAQETADAFDDLKQLDSIIDSILHEEFGSSMNVERLTKQLPGYGKNVDSGYQIVDTGEYIPIKSATQGADSLQERARQKYGSLQSLLDDNPDIKPPRGHEEGFNVSIGSLKPQQLAQALGVQVKKVPVSPSQRLAWLGEHIRPMLDNMPRRSRLKVWQSATEAAGRRNGDVLAETARLQGQKARLLAERQEFLSAKRSMVTKDVRARQAAERVGVIEDVELGVAGQAEEAAQEALASTQARLDDVAGRQSDARTMASMQADEELEQELAPLIEKRAAGTAAQRERQSLYDQTVREGRRSTEAATEARDRAAFDLASAEERVAMIKDTARQIDDRVKRLSKSKYQGPKGRVQADRIREDLYYVRTLIDEAERLGGADGRSLAAAAHQLEQVQKRLLSIDAATEGREVAQSILKVAEKGKWVTTTMPDGTKISPYWEKVITEGWTQADPRILDSDGVMKDAVSKAMKNVIEFASDEDGWKTIDALTQFFKTYATATPGFHVRNAMSAAFMNASDGVKIADQREGLSLWRKMVKSGDGVRWLESQHPRVRQAFEAVYASGAGGQYSAAELGNKLQRGATKLSDNAFTRTSKKIGEDWVEGPVRLALALNEIDRGGDMYSAMARVARIHFDYSKVSNFDKYMKRIIPFWTFMSRNLPLQIQQMWTKPRAYAVYNNFVKNFSEEQEGEIGPQWLQRAGGFPVARNIGAFGGADLWLRPDMPHVNAQADVGEMFESPLSILSSANPLFRAPVELYANKTAFTGAPIRDESESKTDQTMDSLWYALQQIASPIGQAQRVAGTGRYDGKELEKRLNYLGVPITAVGDQERAAELRRRAYAGT